LDGFGFSFTEKYPYNDKADNDLDGNGFEGVFSRFSFWKPFTFLNI